LRFRKCECNPNNPTTHPSSIPPPWKSGHLPTYPPTVPKGATGG
jgi:hypothetical protein